VTVFILVVVFAVVAMWWVRRRRRQSVLAGRDSARPTYMVEPPARSVGNRRTELL
jgi:hypothetical protein